MAAKDGRKSRAKMVGQRNARGINISQRDKPPSPGHALSTHSSMQECAKLGVWLKDAHQSGPCAMQAAYTVMVHGE